MQVLFVFFIFLSFLAMACGGVKPKQHVIHAKDPLKFFQSLWAKIHSKSDTEPEVICTINGAKGALNDKRAELLELDNQKASLQKVIKKLNADMEKLKVTTQTARRDLSNVLLEKTRSEKSIADAEQQKMAKHEETVTEEPFPSNTVLTFTSVALLLCFVAAVSKLYESNIKINKLTQRLASKTQSSPLVVDKEVVVYRNRIAELESQGQRDRTEALTETASLHEQLDRYKEEKVVFQRQVSELKKEQENLLAAAAATAVSSSKTLETMTGNIVSTDGGPSSVVTMVVMEDASERDDSHMPAKSSASAGVSDTSTANTARDLVAATTARAIAEKQVEALTVQGKKDAEEIASWKTRVAELETAKVMAERSIADLTAVHVSCGTEIAALKRRIAELEDAKVMADRSINDLTRHSSGEKEEIMRLQQLQQQQQRALDKADEQQKLAVAALEQSLEQAATQAAKTSTKLREEKDVALTEWKRASETVDSLEDRMTVMVDDLENVKTERDGLKREKEQWLAAKQTLTLSMEHNKNELASCMQRISELEEVGKGQAIGCQQLVVVKRERDELLEGKARTDQCFLDMESQLTQEKRKVLEHLNTIRELEQRLMELERRKHFDRMSHSTGLSQGRGGSLTPPHTNAVVDGSTTPPSINHNTTSSSISATRLQELMAQADKDAQEIKALRDERDALLSFKNNVSTGETETKTPAHTQPGNSSNNSPDNNKLQTQLAALLKQRDLLLTSKTILEEHIGEYKNEIKWCDNDRERLKKKETALEKQVQSLDDQLTTQQQQTQTLQKTVLDLTEKITALEASLETSESQATVLRERVKYLVATKDAKEREHRRDLQQMKETNDRSDVLESTCGELTEQLARMQEQRDVLRVKAAHARFGARTQGVILHPGANADNNGGASMNESSQRSRDHLGGNVDEEGGSSDDGTEDTWREVVQRGGNEGGEGNEIGYRIANNNNGDDEDGHEEDNQSLRSYLRRAQRQKAKAAAAASSSSSNIKQGQGLPSTSMYPPVEEDALLADLRHTQSQQRQRQQASAGTTSSSSQSRRHHRSSGHASSSSSSRRNQTIENASVSNNTTEGDDLSFFGNTNSMLTAIQSFLSVSTDQPQSSTQSNPDTTVERHAGNGTSKRDDENDSLFGLILPKS